jgi:asparagine synthase (glutamine-hydrolysing)
MVGRSSREVGSEFEAVASEMANTLRHRGPDNRGLWTDLRCGVALAHTRLSILDLSASGHQPMMSRDGRFVLVFNGEIYNFRHIRARLETAGHAFRGDSDTEVLVEAIAEWGAYEAIESTVGMFAFAVWDREEQTIILARDRMGEKPLYYGWVGSTFVFASELKAICAHPSWRGTIDRQALTLYLRHSYIPGPHTIYRGIYKLPPGCLLRVARFVPGTVPEPEPYWSLEEMSGPGGQADIGSDAEIVETLEGLLRDAVGQQMAADVPLGAFLSGGIDSSTVVALMQAQSSQPVRTFTIGFDQPTHDEAPSARRIAKHLGTDHTELYVRPEDALEVVPRLSRIYDEPFADSSQIPTLLVSQLARHSVTVSLSGDGGDELFGGYATYNRGAQIHRLVQRIPGPLRRRFGRVLLTSSVSSGLRWIGGSKGSLIAERTARLAEILSQRSPLATHRALYSQWIQPASLVVGGSEPTTVFTDPVVPWAQLTFEERMSLVDASTYLPDDLLVKVDRAAMSVSLETRVPLLDHRVVEFAMRLPWSMKVRDGVGKWALRQVLDRYVPRELVNGPKKGFAIPIDEWLRGPLMDWAGSLLDRDRIAAEGFFVPEPIAARWAEHRAGTRDWSECLWAVLMFQAWNETRLQGQSNEPDRARAA